MILPQKKPTLPFQLPSVGSVPVSQAQREGKQLTDHVGADGAHDDLRDVVGDASKTDALATHANGGNFTDDRVADRSALVSHVGNLKHLTYPMVA
jgi:hypothetical protein